MLVLSRKVNESIIVNENIVITINKIDGDSVKLGIKAPKEIRIYREEVFESIRKSNMAAVLTDSNSIKLPHKMLLNLDKKLSSVTNLSAKEMEGDSGDNKQIKKRRNFNNRSD